jgi:hypothetical protein
VRSVVSHIKDGHGRRSINIIIPRGKNRNHIPLERKLRLETNIANLYKENGQLDAHHSTINYSDQDLAIIDEFCKKIRDNLDQATFDGKRRVLELLDVHGTLAIENDEKVLYITCAIYPQPVSLVVISPLSNTGEIVTRLYTSQPTALSP